MEQRQQGREELEQRRHVCMCGMQCSAELRRRVTGSRDRFIQPTHTNTHMHTHSGNARRGTKERKQPGAAAAAGSVTAARPCGGTTSTAGSDTVPKRQPLTVHCIRPLCESGTRGAQRHKDVDKLTGADGQWAAEWGMRCSERRHSSQWTAQRRRCRPQLNTAVFTHTSAAEIRPKNAAVPRSRAPKLHRARRCRSRRRGAVWCPGCRCPEGAGAERRHGAAQHTAHSSDTDPQRRRSAPHTAAMGAERRRPLTPPPPSSSGARRRGRYTPTTPLPVRNSAAQRSEYGFTHPCCLRMGLWRLLQRPHAQNARKKGVGAVLSYCGKVAAAALQQGIGRQLEFECLEGLRFCVASGRCGVLGTAGCMHVKGAWRLRAGGRVRVHACRSIQLLRGRERKGTTPMPHRVRESHGLFTSLPLVPGGGRRQPPVGGACVCGTLRGASASCMLNSIYMQRRPSADSLPHWRSGNSFALGAKDPRFKPVMWPLFFFFLSCLLLVCSSGMKQHSMCTKKEC